MEASKPQVICDFTSNALCSFCQGATSWDLRVPCCTRSGAHLDKRRGSHNNAPCMVLVCHAHAPPTYPTLQLPDEMGPLSALLPLKKSTLKAFKSSAKGHQWLVISEAYPKPVQFQTLIANSATFHTSNMVIFKPSPIQIKPLTQNCFRGLLGHDSISHTLLGKNTESPDAD